MSEGGQVSRIYSYLFEEVETERIMATPEMILLFNKLRSGNKLFKSYFKKIFLINLSCFLVLVGMVFGIKKKGILKLSKTLLLLMVTNSSGTFILAILRLTVLIHIAERIKSDLPIVSLRNKLRSLFVSRIMTVISNLSTFLKIANILNIILSTHISLSPKAPLPLRMNCAVSWLYMSHFYFFIHYLKRMSEGELNPDQLREIITEHKKVLYSDIKGIESRECLICFCYFNPTDTIIQLNCDEKHLFHEICLRGWFQVKNKCPICKKLS